jgi:hypothetical protein
MRLDAGGKNDAENFRQIVVARSTSLRILVWCRRPGAEKIVEEILLKTVGFAARLRRGTVHETGRCYCEQRLRQLAKPRTGEGAQSRNSVTENSNS